jgi:hypothetical protein
MGSGSRSYPILSYLETSDSDLESEGLFLARARKRHVLVAQMTMACARGRPSINGYCYCYCYCWETGDARSGFHPFFKRFQGRCGCKEGYGAVSPRSFLLRCVYLSICPRGHLQPLVTFGTSPQHAHACYELLYPFLPFSAILLMAIMENLVVVRILIPLTNPKALQYGCERYSLRQTVLDPQQI